MAYVNGSGRYGSSWERCDLPSATFDYSLPAQDTETEISIAIGLPTSYGRLREDLLADCGLYLLHRIHLRRAISYSLYDDN